MELKKKNIKLLEDLIKKFQKSQRKTIMFLALMKIIFILSEY